jgi:creatinine amidohydrolase
MGVFSDRLDNEVRLERMRPEQAASAREACPAIYVPFGSIEWHGYQNPVGLDAIKAHEQLVGLARMVGGVVYPAVFFGAGGGHTEWPSSYMVGADAMVLVVADLLAGFERDGFRKAILLSGHYPNRSEYQDAAVALFRERGGSMDILSVVENQVEGVDGDHAARCETSFLLYLHPETVDLERLGPEPAGQAERRNWMTEEWKDHPCYGQVGTDPRGTATEEHGRRLTLTLINALATWVRTGELPRKQG